MVWFGMAWYGMLCRTRSSQWVAALLCREFPSGVPGEAMAPQYRANKANLVAFVREFKYGAPLP